MIFFEKMYVGFKRDRYQNDENPRLLGFAVPHDDTKSSKNRRNTVDGWRQKDIEPRTIDNIPTRGFKIQEAVSRHSTSNKLFRIIDPRGFELEITADNLVDLAVESTIVKGEIIDECLWAGGKGTIYLASISNPLYKQHVSVKTDGTTKIVEGDYYVAVGNMISVFRYEGIYHHTYLDVKHVATKGNVTKDPNFNGRYSYYGVPDIINVEEYVTKVDVLMNTGSRPSNVYTEFRLDADGNVESKSVHVRKGHFKNLKRFNGDVTQDMSDYKPDMLQWVDEGGYWDEPKKKTDNMISNTSQRNSAYFKSKQDAKNFDYAKVIESLRPSDTYYNQLDVSGLTSNYSDRGYYNRQNTVTILNAKRTFEVTDKR